MKKLLFAVALSTSVLFADESKVGEFVWNELATNDVQAAKDFYGKVFGWEFTEHDMDGKKYIMIQKGDKQFGGIWAIPNDQKDYIPPHWMSYILVEDIQDSVNKARQNGAKIIKPVQKAGEAGLFVILADPTGAHIALWQPLRK